MENYRFTQCHNCKKNFPFNSNPIQCGICNMVEYCTTKCKKAHSKTHKLTCDQNDKYVTVSMRKDINGLFANTCFMDLLYALNYHWKHFALECYIVKNNILAPQKTRLFEDFFVVEITKTQIENSVINVTYCGINNISDRHTLTCDKNTSKLIYEESPEFELEKLTENKLIFVASNVDFVALEIVGNPIAIRNNAI